MSETRVKSSFTNYLYLHATFLLYSLIMLYMKWSSHFSIASIFFYLAYAGLVGLLFVYAVIWQQVIVHFDISKAYSHRGIIIVWTLLWSVLFFHESIHWNQILGIGIIIFGIGVVTRDE